MLDTVTFGLAFVAYLLLGTCVAAVAWGRRPGALSVVLAVVLAAHVGLVWTHRFELSPAKALEKGLAGFVVFHAAFGLIMTAPFLRGAWNGRLLVAAFPIVTAGAVGAAFRYPYVAVYQVPLLAAAGATVGIGSLGWLRRRRRG